MQPLFYLIHLISNSDPWSIQSSCHWPTIQFYTFHSPESGCPCHASVHSDMFLRTKSHLYWCTFRHRWLLRGGIALRRSHLNYSRMYHVRGSGCRPIRPRTASRLPRRRSRSPHGRFLSINLYKSMLSPYLLGLLATNLDYLLVFINQYVSLSDLNLPITSMQQSMFWFHLCLD